MSEFKCEVKIVDSIMGSGKTCAAINYINHSVGEKFIVITPYLTEVERYKECCKDKKFVTPSTKNGKGTKLEGLKWLINRGANIVSTHALFQRFNNDIIELCRVNHYTLILDEVADVISTYYISDHDLHNLKQNYIDIDEETGLFTWRKEKSDYTGEFSQIKDLCELGSLAYYKGSVIMWLFPVRAFNAFRKVFVLTYMFEAQLQRYYYDFYKLPYQYISVSGDNSTNYNFVNKTSIEHNTFQFQKNIHIINHEKLNDIGDTENSLSKTWFERYSNTSIITQLKNNLSNYFRHIRDDNAKDVIWTTFKDYKSLLKGKGYTKGFVSLNARAMNDFQDRTSIAYIANRYVNPNIRNFFSQHNITIDEDKYALSEMLQFIWRSAIRNGEEIWIYVPSIRMRRLLEEWINDGEKPEKSSIHRTMFKVNE